jgi:capsular polysaccharide biosynthesis protein
MVLEEMTWSDQIVAFCSAREIVAPHGAGLANLVFCERGTRVVELFNSEYVNPCFWRLAAVRGLDYRPVVDDPNGSVRQHLPANRCDIDIPPSVVVSALLA